MINENARAFFCLILAAALIGISLAASRSDPIYKGKPLTRWLQQCASTPLMETQRLAEAQAAVRAIGARRALPELLRLVKTKDRPVRDWITARSDKFHWTFLQWPSAGDLQLLGVAGFEALNTNAAPAVGELARLLNEKNHAFIAMRCLSSIGKPAEPVLRRALTNQDEAVRKWGVDGLAGLTDSVDVYIACIKGRLNDSSATVRVTAVEDIGIQTTAPELAIPLLIPALKDPSDTVRAHAAGSLGNFGTNALGAWPLLHHLVESASPSTAAAALRSLVMIAPKASLAILTNSIARGRIATDGALRALADAAPEIALPVIIDGVESPNPRQRFNAFALLTRYPMTTKVESAMQTLAAGPDSDLARRAKEILTEKYQKDHPLEPQFSHEPNYEGKALGEWLKMHDNEGAFSETAKEAFRFMGTNAIPALLQRLAYVQPPFDLPAFEINIDAVRGLILLGDAAKSALPQLQALMDGANSGIAVDAMMAACGTGSNALPLLIRGLTNRFADVRNEAANCLTDGVGARFPGQRKPAIPLFVKLLNDADENVRVNATNQLKEIDPQAAARAGIK